VGAIQQRFLVLCNSRGNAGYNEITAYLYTAAGSLVMQIPTAYEVHTDNILYTQFCAIQQADISSYTTPGDSYYIRLETLGAFQVGCGILHMANVDQTFDAITSSANAGGTAISLDITPAANPGIIVDSWASDGSGVLWTPSGMTRGSIWMSYSIDVMAAEAAYTIVSDDSTQTLGWGGDFQNRNNMYATYRRAVLPGSPPGFNVNSWAANF